MTVKLDNLRVIYHIEEGVDTALDEALTEVVEAHGWQQWASGCDHTTGERDLAFERIQEGEG